MTTITHQTAETQFIEVDGANFAYRRWGNANTEQAPLFFLQHFRGGLDNWDPLITDGLAQGREVILFNGRGIASSTGQPRTRIEDMADDAAAVIRALGLKQVDLLGFSLGGFQAQDLVRRHPELVRKLMLLGTGPRGGKPRGDDPEVAALVLKHATTAVPSEEDFLFLFLADLKLLFRQGMNFGNVAMSVKTKIQQVQLKSCRHR